MAKDQPSGARDDSQGLSKEELRRRAIIAKQLSSAFGDIVSLLMRSESERSRALADLEWMVIPALQTGQFAVAEGQSKETGMVSPMGAVLWAMVSDEVDQRISSQLDKPLKLQQSEWRSGEIPWIVAAFGDPKVVGQLLEELSKNVFKQRSAKLRSRGEDGKAFVGKLEFKPAQTS